MSQHINPLPRGFRHLDVIHKNKFVEKYPSKARHPTRVFVQPKDRIKRWNVVPGDKVRLLAGKDSEMYNDEEDRSQGYKVYSVADIDMERNRLFLIGLTNKKPNPIRKKPDNFDELPEEEKKSFLEQKPLLNVRRPVHYSNVQLCVKDAGGAGSVFAKHIGTSPPVFNRSNRRWEWSRFATKTSAGALGDNVQIPWPKVTPRKPVDPTPWDTMNHDALQRTLHLGAPRTIPERVLPRSMTAPTTKDQSFADEYIFRPTTRTQVAMEAAMPLYLGEELSPRFARAKKQRGWQLRRELENTMRDKVARVAVAEWEAGGRDEGIAEVFHLDVVGLEGVEIRSRTRKEVREASHAELDANIAAVKAATRRAKAAGQLFDMEAGEWVDGPKGHDLARRKARKERKERKIVEKLASLTLKEKKNQIIPPDLRQ